MPQGIAAETIAGLSIAGQAIAAAGSQPVGYATQYTPGSYTFVPPKAGYYKFVLWGAGDGSNPGGASGAYSEKTVFLTVAQSVPIVVGLGNAGAPGGDTTVSLPGVAVVTAGGGNGATPGVASGGDLNLNGSTSGNPGLGSGGGPVGSVGGNPAGAPGVLPFRGGGGATGPTLAGISPGGGGSAGASAWPGGMGMVIALFVRP